MKNSKATKRDKGRRLIAGLRKHFREKDVTLKGKEVKTSTIIKAIKKSMAAGADTDAKRVVYLAASQVSKAANATSDPLVVELTEFLRSTMSSTDLSDFGLAPKKRGKQTVETKAAANEKREATRNAGGGVGTKEKSNGAAKAVTTSASN